MDPIQLIGGFKGEIIGSAQKLGLTVYGRLKTSWKFQNKYYFVDLQIGQNFTVSTPWQLPLKLSFPRHYELSMSGQNRMTPSSFAELRKSLALLGRDGDGLCLQCVSKSATICQHHHFLGLVFVTFGEVQGQFWTVVVTVMKTTLEIEKIPG